MNKLWLALLFASALWAQAPKHNPGYILGPGDRILIRALETGDLFQQPVLINTNGIITLPMIGQVQAGGISVEQLEAKLNQRLKKFIQDPQASVTVVDFASQPVYVLGAVNTPGVFQLRGGKTLYEVLAMAGGPRQTAGTSVTITRQIGQGKIPLSGVTIDPTGRFSVAKVDVEDILKGNKPASDIELRPYDVISVSQANSNKVYVVGDVERAGAFTLGAQRSISVLKVLSLAGGLGRTARAKKARILREPQGKPCQQIEINIDRILAGKAEDIGLRPGDVLVVPTSSRKMFTTRILPGSIAATAAAAIYATAIH